MTDPISPGRLAEIHEAAARWLEGDLKNPSTTSVFRHRAELLAEVDRLKARNDAAEEAIDIEVTSRLEVEAEVDRLWYFIDHQDGLDDIITGRPDHYIVNGDHTGCDCGTEWTPPPVQVEWTAAHPYDDGRPGLCTHGNQGEANARQMASHGDGWVVQRRLVGPWRDADETRPA